MNTKLFIFAQIDVEEISTVEELILARFQLKTMDQGFQDLKLDTPEWIIDKLTDVIHEINVRVKGELARRLRSAKARRSALRSADEKRKDLEAEISELEAQLA